MTSGRCRK